MESGGGFLVWFCFFENMMDVNITLCFFCVSGSHQVCVRSPSGVFHTPPFFLSILTYFGLPQKQTGDQNVSRSGLFGGNGAEYWR